MGVRSHKPLTPGQRHRIVDTFQDITVAEPYKSLIAFKKKKNGRNNQGIVSVRHRGGGNARHYRLIDFKQDKFDIPATVETIEYDPNRSARIARLVYKDGERRYIVAPEGIKIGSVIVSSQNLTEVKLGNRMPLKYIPEGTFVYNVELNPNRGGVLARSAGVGVQLLVIEGQYAHLKLPSKEVRKISKECLASIGQVSNIDHHLISLGKAGISRKKGIRPNVRGKAMNPVDHPHGGGNGRNPIGLKHAKTQWGKIARGVKTRNKKKYSTKSIISRRIKA